MSRIRGTMKWKNEKFTFWDIHYNYIFAIDMSFSNLFNGCMKKRRLQVGNLQVKNYSSPKTEPLSKFCFDWQSSLCSRHLQSFKSILLKLFVLLKLKKICLSPVLQAHFHLVSKVLYDLQTTLSWNCSYCWCDCSLQIRECLGIVAMHTVLNPNNLAFLCIYAKKYTDINIFQYKYCDGVFSAIPHTCAYDHFKTKFVHISG